MYYILTTFFQDHWDQVRNNRTGYKLEYVNIPSEQLINNTPTIFLRINRQTREIEKAWLGKVFDIETTEDKLNFSLIIDSEIEVQPEFVRTNINWYVIDSLLELNREELDSVKSDKLNIHVLEGNWDSGWALDIHSLHSVKLPDSKFDTTHTLIGGYLNKLKYWKDKTFAPKITELACQFLKSNEFSNILAQTDVIIPVPPSDEKRVFQPVYELAEGISKNISKQLDLNYLKKLKSTSEIKSIDEIEKRKKILLNAFDVEDERYKDKNILLFDDIYRSGVTLEEVTKILKEKGKVKKVFVLTITKTRTKR